MKTKWIPQPDEFFIGYLPKAPNATSSFLKRVIMGMAASIVVTSALLVISQKSFSDGEFEYGEYTTIEGHILSYPVPHIKLKPSPDSLKPIHPQTVLLVGIGKAGASQTLASYESALGALAGKLVKISGEAIHGNGKTLLQISEDRIPEVLHDESDQKFRANFPSMGTSNSVTGEIVDPKCYFGVMKPGEGKAHRSCAIRCIAGGIPPVFRATNSSEYYLLLDEDYQPVNQLVQDIVGDKIELSGKVIEWDDWKILLINKVNLKNLETSLILKRNLASIDDGMTHCR